MSHTSTDLCSHPITVTHAAPSHSCAEAFSRVSTHVIWLDSRRCVRVSQPPHGKDNQPRQTHRTHTALATQLMLKFCIHSQTSCCHFGTCLDARILLSTQVGFLESPWESQYLACSIVRPPMIVIPVRPATPRFGAHLSGTVLYMGKGLRHFESGGNTTPLAWAFKFRLHNTHRCPPRNTVIFKSKLFVGAQIYGNNQPYKFLISVVGHYEWGLAAV